MSESWTGKYRRNKYLQEFELDLIASNKSEYEHRKNSDVPIFSHNIIAGYLWT